MVTTSPFPGMDPFLEDPVEWGGIYTRLMNSISDQLLARVQPNFSVKIEQHVYLLGADETQTRQIVPDLYLVETPLQNAWAGAAAGL